MHALYRRSSAFKCTLYNWCGLIRRCLDKCCTGSSRMVNRISDKDVHQHLQLRSMRPSKTPATTRAHAPVPHARVAPAPRSHTLIFTWDLLNTCCMQCRSVNILALQSTGECRLLVQHKIWG